MEISPNKSLVQRFGSISQRGPYRGKRAETTLRSLSSPTGVIVEYHVKRALEEQGFTFDIERDNKSKFDPDKLFTALSRYDGHRGLQVDEDVFRDAIALTMARFGGSRNLKPLSTREELMEAIKVEKSSGAPLFTSKVMLSTVTITECVGTHRGI